MFNKYNCLEVFGAQGFANCKCISGHEMHFANHSLMGKPIDILRVCGGELCL